MTTLINLEGYRIWYIDWRARDYAVQIIGEAAGAHINLAWFQREIIEWLDAMVPGGWFYSLSWPDEYDGNIDAAILDYATYAVLAFRDPAMATLFKLTWGGV